MGKHGKKNVHGSFGCLLNFRLVQNSFRQVELACTLPTGLAEVVIFVELWQRCMCIFAPFQLQTIKSGSPIAKAQSQSEENLLQANLYKNGTVHTILHVSWNQAGHLLLSNWTVRTKTVNLKFKTIRLLLERGMLSWESIKVEK